MKGNKRLEEAKKLWEKLGDIPVDEREGQYIDEEFLDFPIGTDREDIWHWFESEFNVSVAVDLMNL